MPPSPASTPDPAEIARQEKELREAQALIADIQKRRVSYTVPDARAEGGISGWLIRKKVVQKESQANIALLGVVIVAVVLAGMSFIWSGSSRPHPTAQEIQAMQQPPVSAQNANLAHHPPQ
jgi:hypothetical protein